jgi:hypothetical protein
MRFLVLLITGTFSFFVSLFQDEAPVPPQPPPIVAFDASVDTANDTGNETGLDTGASTETGGADTSAPDTHDYVGASVLADEQGNCGCISGAPSTALTSPMLIGLLAFRRRKRPSDR